MAAYAYRGYARSIRKLLILTVVALAASLFVPAGASALRVWETQKTQVDPPRFSEEPRLFFADPNGRDVGPNCGESMERVIGVPTGAYRLGVLYPLVGTPLESAYEEDYGKTVARITEAQPTLISPRQKGVRWVGTASNDVCSRPLEYRVKSWFTEDVPAAIRYRINRAVFVLADAGNSELSMRPRRFSALDQPATLYRIRWRRWGGSTARGRGTLFYGDCFPMGDCEGVRRSRHRGRVVLSRPRRCASGEYTYRRLTFIAHRKPKRLKRKYTSRLDCG